MRGRVGVVVTHVAFQTGHQGGRLPGRFDLAVACSSPCRDASVVARTRRSGEIRGHTREPVRICDRGGACRPMQAVVVIPSRC